MAPSLLDDSLQTLAENNEKNMDIADEDMGYFKNTKCAGILLNIKIVFPSVKLNTISIFLPVNVYVFLLLTLRIHFNIYFFTIEYIFNLCDALKVPVEARYLAIEIYDRLVC